MGCRVTWSVCDPLLPSGILSDCNHTATASSYHNPLIKTNALSKSFQKKKTCGNSGRSHNHSECPAWGQMCPNVARRTTGHRCAEHRESGCTSSPHKQQNREKTINQQAQERLQGRSQQQGCSLKKSTPKKQGGGGHHKTFKATSLEVIQR